MPPRPTVPRGYIRRPYAYPLAFTTVNDNNALAASGGQKVLILTGDVGINSAFTHLAFAATGSFFIQIRPSDLNAGLFNAPIHSSTLLALLDRPGQLPYPIKVIGSNTLRVELTNDNGALATEVNLTFWGYRDFPCAGTSPQN